MTSTNIITKAIYKQHRKDHELLRKRGGGYTINKKPAFRFSMPDGLGVWLLSTLDENKGFYGLCDLGLENSTFGYFTLNQLQPTAKNLNHLLYSYTKDGMYARFFEGANSLDIENPLVVLALEELKSKKTRQEIVLLLLMHQISQTMYCDNRLQKKTCIIDAAWDLLPIDDEARNTYVKSGYKKKRRDYRNFHAIMCSPQDYYNIAASQKQGDNL